LQIKQQLTPGSLDVAIGLNNLGTVARDSGDLDRAYNYHLQSLQIREQLAPESLAVANSLHNLGVVARDRGQFDRACDYYLHALLIRQQLAPGSLTVALSLNPLGDIARARGDLSSAHEYYGEALEALENQVLKLGGSYNTEAGFRAQHGYYYYHDMLDLLLDQRRPEDAFQILERFRAQTFLTMLAERDTMFTMDVPEELDRERRRLVVRYDNTMKRLVGLNLRDHAEEIEVIRAELAKLNDEVGDHEARIRRTVPRLAALRYPSPLDAGSARDALDPETLMLSYSVGEDETALFVLSLAEGLKVKILSVGSETLRSQVRKLRSVILETKPGSSLSGGRMQLFQAESRALYDSLLKPVADQIAASERLLILPAGPLHDLPFAALIRSGTDDDSGDQYLVEWKPLHVALSATVFAELKQERRANQGGIVPPAPMKIAAFGDPIYPAGLTAVTNEDFALPAPPGDVDPPGSTLVADVAFPADPTVRSAAERGIFDWPPLPYTRREVEGIASLFPEGTVRTFLGAEALEERIKGLDRDTRILHIAAHAHTDEHLPSSSFIALTIPEDVIRDDSDTERDNGLLQVWEIFERVRIDADLVVLSACESGLGQELGTEGLIGLTRAFQYAGARSVVASLWSVADQSTSELMIRFYRHLRDGLSKDEALRAAQIELIRGPIEVTDADGRKVRMDASAPYYWAAFQVYGDWQ
jgi:CHAT domain-containing protein